MLQRVCRFSRRWSESLCLAVSRMMRWKSSGSIYPSPSLSKWWKACRILSPCRPLNICVNCGYVKSCLRFFPPLYKVAHSQFQSNGMLSGPLFISYNFFKSSYLTCPVPSTSNNRNAISYSASGFARRFSKVPQSNKLIFPVFRLSATLKRMAYCSRLILCYSDTPMVSQWLQKHAQWEYISHNPPPPAQWH